MSVSSSSGGTDEEVTDPNPAFRELLRTHLGVNLDSASESVAHTPSKKNRKKPSQRRKTFTRQN